MHTKQPIRMSFWSRNRVSLPLLFATLCTSLSFIFLVPNTSVYAQGNPGGNISDPVVRAVDLAKPAVVRIITTINGHISVTFPNQSTVAFPLDGTSYKVQFSGSGAFISSHGDILTADHVVQPPHDATLDQALETVASQDIADYVNKNFPASLMPYSAQDIYANLQDGGLPSQTSYATPQSAVYLSQDYTGPSYSANKLSAVPSYAHAIINRIEAQSPSGQHDVAIVHVNMNDTPSIHLDDSSNVAEQDQLTIIGFPGNGDLTTPQHGNETSFLTSSVNTLYVSSLKMEDNGTPVIQVGGNVEHGDSGGPALDSQGNIVGIVSFSSANGDTPIGTSFLQVSNSARQLLVHTSIDTTPGRFETAWQHAFADYTATTPGHWNSAFQDFANLQQSYPHFGAILPFVTYTQAQAQQASSSNQSSPLLLIMFFILLILLGVGLFLYMRSRAARRQRSQAVWQKPVAHYPPATPFEQKPMATPYAQDITRMTTIPPQTPDMPQPQIVWQNYLRALSIREENKQSVPAANINQRIIANSGKIPRIMLPQEDRLQTLQNIFGYDNPLLTEQAGEKREDNVPAAANGQDVQRAQPVATPEVQLPFTDIEPRPIFPPAQSQEEKENETTSKMDALRNQNHR